MSVIRVMQKPTEQAVVQRSRYPIKSGLIVFLSEREHNLARTPCIKLEGPKKADDNGR